MNDLELLEALIDPVREACRVIQSVRERGAVAREKSDKSPVTEADEAAEVILTAALHRLTPGRPIVGEEAFSAGFVPEDCGSTFWLVDPVDGTREFLRGGDDYTVNVGLVSDYAPRLGIVATPANGRIWAGAIGHGAFMIEPDGTRLAISTRTVPGRPVAVVSHSHLDDETKAFLVRQGPVDQVSIGSSLKFCLVAEGKADVYPRFGPTSEWDTAAGDAVLRAAGGSVCHPDGTPFRYGKTGFGNGAFIARG